MAEKIKDKMIMQLGQHLTTLGISFVEEGEVFSVSNTEGQPFGTFIIVPRDFRVSFFFAMPFEILADKLEDMLIAVNTLNGLLPNIRIYIDVSNTSNAVFCDQYIFCASGNVPEYGIKNIIATYMKMSDKYGKILSGLNDGKLSLSDFLKAIR